LAVPGMRQVPAIQAGGRDRDVILAV